MNLTNLRINNLADVSANTYSFFGDPDLVLKSTTGIVGQVQQVIDPDTDNGKNPFDYNSTFNLSSTSNYCNNLTVEPKSYFLITRYAPNESSTLSNIEPDCVIKAMGILDSGENLRLLENGLVFEEILAE